MQLKSNNNILIVSLASSLDLALACMYMKAKEIYKIFMGKSF